MHRPGSGVHGEADGISAGSTCRYLSLVCVLHSFRLDLMLALFLAFKGPSMLISPGAALISTPIHCVEWKLCFTSLGYLLLMFS